VIKHTYKGVLISAHIVLDLILRVSQLLHDHLNDFLVESAGLLSVLSSSILVCMLLQESLRLLKPVIDLRLPILLSQVDVI
jgi:hypothetical protein